MFVNTESPLEQEWQWKEEQFSDTDGLIAPDERWYPYNIFLICPQNVCYGYSLEVLSTHHICFYEKISEK